jgi:hypothetical protein
MILSLGERTQAFDGLPDCREPVFAFLSEECYFC